MNYKQIRSLIAAGVFSAATLAGNAYAQDPATPGDSKPKASKKHKKGKAHAKGHSCAGQNACKGHGGCKTGDAGCAGKNSCKGKGGCASSMKPEASPAQGKSDIKTEASPTEHACKGHGGCKSAE